jgi:hypothetical protein
MCTDLYLKNTTEREHLENEGIEAYKNVNRENRL